MSDNVTESRTKYNEYLNGWIEFQESKELEVGIGRLSPDGRIIVLPKLPDDSCFGDIRYSNGIFEEYIKNIELIDKNWKRFENKLVDYHYSEANPDDSFPPLLPDFAESGPMDLKEREIEMISDYNSVFMIFLKEGKQKGLEALSMTERKYEDLKKRDVSTREISGKFWKRYTKQNE